MSSVSTFGTFTTARLGIYAAQKGLQITGNNISNINTVGYTRQVLDQISLRTGGSDRYASQYDVKVGNGALPVGVSQIRDPYLDIRYRNEMSSVGALDTKLTGLDRIAAILDEVAKGDDEMGVIDAQLSDLYAALQNLNGNTGQEEFDSQVRSSATSLAILFNTYASRLSKEKENAVTQFNQQIETVNNLLNNIKDLNSSIRKSDIHGDNTLEQRDERNRLLDELSQYMKIDVTYSMEDIGAGQMVEKLTVKLAGANPHSTELDPQSDRAVLIDGVYGTQLEVNTDINNDTGMPNYDITLAGLTDTKGRPIGSLSGLTSDIYKDDNGDPLPIDITSITKTTILKSTYDAIQDKDPKPIDDGMGTITAVSYREGTDSYGNTIYQRIVTTSNYYKEVKLDDNDLYGGLQAQRELLTEAGEFSTEDAVAKVDESAATKRGIPYYQKALDLLANQFAKIFNEANQGFQVDENGNQVLDEKGNPIPMGGVLFSSVGDDDDPTDITAANITVSKSWATGATHVVSSYVRPVELDGPTSTDSSNITHLIALMTTKTDYCPSDVVKDKVPVNGTTPMFHGTFQEMLGNIQSVLGNDQRSTNIQLNNYYISSVDLDTQRDSVSGVDLNDEAMNLMQYQKAYSAACRLMTTLDEALDKLINGTGVVGR